MKQVDGEVFDHFYTRVLTQLKKCDLSDLEERMRYPNDVKHTCLYDRVKKLLVSYEWSDCCFFVVGQHFKAHKLIMGISSPVFEAMFYGPLSSNDSIIITDIEPDTFQLLLNYIYTDNVEISSIEEAFELLYASKKYILEHLTELCITYIKENISIDNVTSILNYPEFMQDKQLISCALKLFCEHARFLLQEKKPIISLCCMKNILLSNHINIDEKSLIRHVFDWTVQYCEQNNTSNSFENRRGILVKNGMFKLLRFYTLSLEDFEEVVKDRNSLLLPSEVVIINKVITSSIDIYNKVSIDSVNSCLLPRNSLKLQWKICHRRPLKSVAPIVIDSTNYIIPSRLKANKSVFITSLFVPTRMAPILHFHNDTTKVYSEQISISVLCESDNSIVKFTNFMNTVEYDSSVCIDLSEPFFMKKGQWYKITFEWSCNTFVAYSYVAEYKDCVYIDQKITFEFEDLFTGSNGSFLGGLNFCL